MYAHQVLEAIDSMKLRIPDVNYQISLAVVKNAIIASRKFNLGNGLDLLRIFESSFNTKEPQTLFNKPDYLRLPFKTCWFEYAWPETEFIINKKKVSMTEGDVPVTKRAMLAIEIAEDCLSVTTFNYFKSIGWDMAPFMSFISIGKPLYECDHVISFLKGRNEPLPEEGEDYNFLCVPLIKNTEIISSDIWNKMYFQETDLDFKALYCSILFLNCKGIIQKQIDPPEKLNKKRKASGKLPMFSYYILEIEQPCKNKNTSLSLNKGNIRLHECRGHFKEFTKEAPLFGKCTGLYWWEPQWRGSAKRGVIIKDYKFKYKECDG